MSVVMTPAGLIDYKVADITLAAWGRHELTIAEPEIPTLMGLCRRYTDQQPSKGAKTPDCIHTTIRADVLIETLVALGAEVRRSSYSIFSTQDQAAAAITATSIPVFAWKGEIEEEYEWRIKQTIFKDGQPWDADMALDDGGDLTEILHKEYPQMLERIHGIIEGTTTGAHRLLGMLKNDILKVLATDVNDPVTKSKNDSKYDYCHSLNDVIKRDTDHLLSGKRALVIDYGDVGKGPPQLLCQESVVVKIAEVDPICAMQTCMDGFEVISSYKNGTNDNTRASIDAALLDRTDLTVTTTGNVNVCDASMLKALKKRAVVCNIGHFDNEIDTVFMRKNWAWGEVKPQVHRTHRTGKDGFDVHNNDYLILLAEDHLANLGNATGHPSRTIDGSFANQMLAQTHLFEQKHADLPTAKRAKHPSVEVLPKRLDKEVALEIVKGFDDMVTQLALKQTEYISVSVEGPLEPDIYRY